MIAKCIAYPAVPILTGLCIWVIYVGMPGPSKEKEVSHVNDLDSGFHCHLVILSLPKSEYALNFNTTYNVFNTLETSVFATPTKQQFPSIIFYSVEGVHETIGGCIFGSTID